MEILIAEDDRDLARLAETILRASGHAVIKRQIFPRFSPAPSAKNLI